jgi:hypothetical protein
VVANFAVLSRRKLCGDTDGKSDDLNQTMQFLGGYLNLRPSEYIGLPRMLEELMVGKIM